MRIGAREIITVRLDNEIVIVEINNSLCNHRVLDDYLASAEEEDEVGTRGIP